MHGKIRFDGTGGEETAQSDRPPTEGINGFSSAQTRFFFKRSLQVVQYISDQQGPDARTDRCEKRIALKGSTTAAT